MSSKNGVGKLSNKTDPLVPLSIFLHEPGVPWEEQGKSTQNPKVCLDPTKAAMFGFKLIDRAATDPNFRELLKRDPVRALADMGITLSSELEENLEATLQKDPDLLIKAMLGKEFPYGTPQQSSQLVVQRTIRPNEDSISNTRAGEGWDE